jgi:hypothetical protein
LGNDVREDWEWIARRAGSRRSIRLQFVMNDATASTDAYAMINSVQPAPLNFQSLPCPVPLEWATPF